MNIKLPNIKRKTCIIIGSVVAVALIAGISVTAIHYKNKKLVADNIPPVEIEEEPSQYADIEKGFKVSTVDGYTSYIIKYVDTEGKNIKVVNKESLIKDTDNVYMDIQEGKDNGVFKDYFDVDGSYYFQLKTGATFAWNVIIDKDTEESITEESVPEEEAEVATVIALHPDELVNSKVVQQIVLIDLSGEIPDITFEEVVSY